MHETANPERVRGGLWLAARPVHMWLHEQVKCEKEGEAVPLPCAELIGPLGSVQGVWLYKIKWSARACPEGSRVKKVWGPSLMRSGWEDAGYSA